jgi:hypothetical protein
MRNASRERLRLEPVAEMESVLLPEHKGAVLRGTATDAVDYVCGSCGAVIAEAVIQTQFFDFGVVCAHCETLVSFAALPPGHGLPLRGTVNLNPGRYRLSATIDTPVEIVMVGEVALARRIVEGGYRAPASGTRELSPELLRRLAAEGRALLGESYEKLAASYERGKRSPTPPKAPHRLIEQIVAADEAAASFASAAPTIDAALTSELDVAVSMFERWRNDPAWPSIEAALSNPTEYLHAVVMLVTAAYLADAGNGVELVRPAATEGRRLPDLRIHVDSRRTVSTEVKTPAALFRPTDPLTLDGARRLVKEQISSAGTSSGGQLDPAHPGLLVVGGFGLREPDLRVLQTAAREEFRRTGRSRKHIAGIAFVTIGAAVDGRFPSLTGIARTEIVLNPAFDGDITLERNVPSAHAFQSAVKDFTANPLPGYRKVGRNEPCWCGSGKKFKRCHGA